MTSPSVVNSAAIRVTSGQCPPAGERGLSISESPGNEYWPSSRRLLSRPTSMRSCRRPTAAVAVPAARLSVTRATTDGAQDATSSVVPTLLSIHPSSPSPTLSLQPGRVASASTSHYAHQKQCDSGDGTVAVVWPRRHTRHIYAQPSPASVSQLQVTAMRDIPIVPIPVILANSLVNQLAARKVM